MTVSRFAKFSWTVLVYNFAVVLWGAYVRATGSGAGCGRHWPTCNGEVIPHAPQVKTLIEFTHRVTSGLSLVLVLAMFIWANRLRTLSKAALRNARLSLVFILTEALLGAGLVLLRLVEKDASVLRAFSMGLHLTNTFFLLATLSLTAWWATFSTAAIRPSRSRKPRSRKLRWLVSAAWIGMIVLGTSGAVAALGDTLFPARSYAEAMAQDLSVASHLFVRLRLLHPLIATCVGAGLLVLATVSRWICKTRKVIVLSRLLALFVVTQYAAGILNVVLLAPVWMQLVHLFLADAVWVLLVLLSNESLRGDVGEASQIGQGEGMVRRARSDGESCCPPLLDEQPSA